MSKDGFYTQLTQYFRRSIVDSERLSPSTKALLDAVKPSEFGVVKKDVPFAVPSYNWELGCLSEDTTNEIFSTLKLSKKIQETDIVIMPRVDLIQVSSLHAIGQQSQIITPLVIQVRLNRAGELKPSDKPPFVPRDWLAPNQSDQVPFANVKTMDEFLTLNPFNASSWSQLLDYCDRMLKSLFEDKVITHGESAKGALFQLNLLDSYSKRNDISLILLEPPIKAGFHILKIYDAIIRGTMPNQLFKKMFSADTANTKTFQDLTHEVSDVLQHVGQMTAEFPLADKQRNALHYINRMKAGDVLAVNGPPGTGKTTLLRSVVADAWVRAALEGDEPPIIVAASSSNQAVTNILDSFARIEETNIDEKLKGRWLPNIDSYGLYACGDNKANTSNPYAYMTKKGIGIMQTMETDVADADMKASFVAYFNDWYSGPAVIDVKGAIANLKKELEDCVHLQKMLPECFIAYQQLIDSINSLYGSEKELFGFIKAKTDAEIKLKDKLQDIESLLDRFLELWQERSILESIFSFLPFIKKRWWLKNEVLARKYKLTLKGTTDGEIRDVLKDQENGVSHLLSEALKVLETANMFKSKLKKESEYLGKMLLQANIDLTVEELTLPKLVNVIDTKLRFKSFKLATHYWEAQWLQKISKGISAPKTPHERVMTYQRYAMLTPCFVSTFNMLPNFFEVSAKDGDSWKSTPLVDGADLLIVDEAGQSLPYVAGASFLIAKKALLVGDIYQIEPVWSISKGIDRANLGMDNLLNESFNYEQFWLKSDLLASSGNLMKVAHRQTCYQQFMDLEKGLYLTEHRRCYDPIIEYCNKLVYQGHLEALRGEPEKKQPLPSMGFVHHESASQRVGTSRTNKMEANIICKWIIENHNELVNGESLHESVSIITPFKMQEKVIRQALIEHGLGQIKVGTVHVFQGAECKVVLFSSVYASNDSAGSKFYDRSSNMMNVAVSRAKNSFIVFGDENSFGLGNSSSPSGLLKQYLTFDTHIESDINLA